jgi:hypothetical protein
MSANAFFNLLYQMAIILSVITLGMGVLHILLSGEEK